MSVIILLGVKIYYNENGPRNIYSISGINRVSSKTLPDYFAKVGDIVVLLYGSNSTVVKPMDIETEVSAFMKESGVVGK